MRAQIHQLELVYPPVSNQEAEWLKDIDEVKEQLSKSNLYFIGQKPETFYQFNSEDEVDFEIQNFNKLSFKVICGDKCSDCVIDIGKIIDKFNFPTNIEYELEIGEKLIRIWRTDSNLRQILEWFTTEKLIFDKSRNIEYILKFEDYIDFFTYDLHYVGISKNKSSLERLIVQPHDKRLRILSNEHPLSKGSRVTDEIILFFFRIKSQEVKQYLKEDDFDEIGYNELDNYTRIIADAEKAFVSVIETKYNEVKFKNYPKSTDGLYQSLVNRLSYSIDENIVFITDSVEFCSVRDVIFSKTKQGDFLAVDFDENIVNLYKYEEEEEK